MALTGNELVQLVNDADMCDYIGRELYSLKVDNTYIEHRRDSMFIEYRILHVYCSDGVYSRIAFNNTRSLNSSIGFIRDLLVHSILTQRKHNDK